MLAVVPNSLSVGFMPRICAKTQAIAGVEAQLLIDGRPLSSDNPLLRTEESRKSLGAWILSMACSRFLLDPSCPQVTVNLGFLSLSDILGFNEIAAAIKLAGASLSKIELLITEAAEQKELTKPQMAELVELQRQGLRVVLNNFGEGWASLIRLQRTPYNGLKLTPSLSMDLIEESLVGVAVMDLARQLGLYVDAGDVKVLMHAKLLARQGCRQLDGPFVLELLSSNTSYI